MAIFNMMYKKVEEGGWKPTDKTIIYMEFEQNISNLSGTQPTSYSTSGLAYEQVGGQYVIKATTTGRNIEYNPNIQSIGTGDFTVSCWYYPVNQSSSQSILWDLEGNSSPRQGIIVRVARYEAPNIIDFKMSFSGDATQESTTSMNLNQWNHIVFTRINGVCRGYINNVKSAEFNSNISVPTSGAAFRVFSRTQYNQSQMAGAMGDKFIFESYGWTDSKISNYYNSTKSIYGL